MAVLRSSLLAVLFMVALVAGARPEGSDWQSPPQDWLDLLDAAPLPWVWSDPAGETLLLADPVRYPPLSELAEPMVRLAGTRANPAALVRHGMHGARSPRLVRVSDGAETPLPLPSDAEVVDVAWTVDGTRFALTVLHGNALGLWLGDGEGRLDRMDGLVLDALLTTPVRWLPDEERLLVLRRPELGPPPPAPAVPAGPEVFESSGAGARSTYEARDLLETAHDDAMFDWCATTEVVLVDARTGAVDVVGAPAPYVFAQASPDGRYLLVKRLVGPWSHEVPWWRFASEAEVWNLEGERLATVASSPLSDSVPVHGVPTTPRAMEWRPTAPHEIAWIEALDGGDPRAEVPHRDRLMRLDAPFDGTPVEFFRAEHRVAPWGFAWGEDGALVVEQRERMRRWRHVWLLNVDAGTARPWFDLDEDDAYGDPGWPVTRPLPGGHDVLLQRGDAVWYTGQGAGEEGERPFLDRRTLGGDGAERLWRCPPDRYESFIGFSGGEGRFLLRSESETDPPNYRLASVGARIEAPAGEAAFALESRPVTRFEDPAPWLRGVEQRLVRYEREDGVPLSFFLYLPPGRREGERLPTVIWAYPLEYSSAETAGQVRGSTRSFLEARGLGPLFFLLRGYAVLMDTAMPMVGDPETVYDGFTDQLVADAEAAVAKAVEIGVADPERIGVIGHSHGALMVASLLANTDLFAAGIARSGSYNKTNQPYGFQAERRSLFEARDAYLQVSPLFAADRIDEPLLLVHGAEDSNPGTRTYQSEILFEAVRGAGGTVRLALLPFEDHGYRARESVEHLLWEELRWFDRYVKGAGAAH